MIIITIKEYNILYILLLATIAELLFALHQEQEPYTCPTSPVLHMLR